MKSPRIANAVGHIDDDLISAAGESKKSKKNILLKWGSVAACLAVLVITGSFIVNMLMNAASENPDGADDRYKDFNIQAAESGILWPWEFETVYERYTEIEIDGIEYRSNGRAVSDALLKDKIGTYSAVGYDDFAEEKYTADFEVYQLRDVARNQYVAVKMENSYYVFKNAEYDPPNNLGELLKEVDLPKVIELSRFSENGDGPDRLHFILNGDDYVWDVLLSCQNAVFIDDEQWSQSDKYHLSFTITSEVLGIYKRAMYITADGYLWTNAFDWAYIYYIGEDAAEKIIKYAKDNSVATEYEPYRNTVTGKIVEITEDHILIDDSILCTNPEDGITFRILLNDIRICRYVDMGIIDIGDTVQITYEGTIDKENENVIDSAISASLAVISGGNVLIPE